MLEDIKKQVLAGQLSLNEALGKSLPDLRGKIPDERLTWLVNELQGYPHALDYYQTPGQFPPYRVVTGEMKLLDSGGNYSDCKHPLANRGSYFLSAPISWLEESASLLGNVAVVEMQELSGPFVKQGGGIVCLTSKDQVTRILNSFKTSFISLIDELTGKQAPNPKP